MSNRQSNLLPEIEAFLEKHDMAESTFGRLALNDWKVIRNIRDGRRLYPETEDRISQFMAGYRPPQSARVLTTVEA